MTEQAAYELLKRYKADQCTEAERALVNDWFMQFNEKDYTNDDELIKRIAQNISHKLPSSNEERKIFSIRPILVSAASILLIILAALFYFQNPTTSVIKENKYDIKPGGNKATITLANGKSIPLDSFKTGITVDDAKIKYNDGTVISNNNSDGSSGLVTISTPRGGEYQIALPDGTKVWLNAATTLQFSANLKRERGERKVKLISGEAYFEVSKDKKRPFIVKTENQEVEVLGTHFNIEAYNLKNIKTTLEEGSVKVIGNKAMNGSTKILKPGEQAIYTKELFTVKSVDVDLAIAWKNGKIQFEDAELKTVMSTLARWYNIEVEYQYYPSDARFSGSIARSKNISEILELLQSTGDAHFKIQERKVLIMK